ncbi:MAG: type II toxin-antitoxin system RelE/ParE family toxin [Phycisphaeraceae bacterium]|nr:type II toxin-antitoxin system RelE/ParE family toxin [Phycisphaerales bacterium]MCB9842513.1 type II toxin-antitoxin system RelE/ParE family toxin [Phycisphaeraceae bacterium]
MRRRLVKENAAEEDLIEIWVYTFQTWGEPQADKYLDQLAIGIAAIANDPASGRDRGAVRAGYRSISVGRHVVFYTFNDEEVRVRRVLHDAMDFETHLPGDDA